MSLSARQFCARIAGVTHMPPLVAHQSFFAPVVRCYNSCMTRASQPIRLPGDVYDMAVSATRIASRTVPQQIAHWARIGRELEMSPDVNHRDIARVLAGFATYDSLDEKEQAIVRDAWSTRIDELNSSLNLAKEFADEGESYSELDDDGNLIIHKARD